MVLCIIGSAQIRASTATVTSPATRVLYLGGLGRSGSTLLDRMLGNLPGVFSGGEVRHIWSRSLLEGEVCGCGQDFTACRFWAAVGKRAFGGWDRVDLDRVLFLERAVDRHRFLPLLAFPRAASGFDRRVREYAHILAPLYRAIREEAGAEVVVDSTMDPSYGFLLRHVPDVDLRVVHLVRDSRGVAYSWTKPVPRPGIVGRVARTRTYPPVRIGLRWLEFNAMMEWLGRLAPVTTILYEDVVRNPRTVITSIARAAGLSVGEDELGFVSDGTVHLGDNHAIAGNRMKFERGTLPLRLDDEWRSRLGPMQQRLVSTATWPLLKRYGYV
jgi:hypothetical protein